ncbi:MAG: hypothetical protein FWG64_04705 [Firmicutes bacterium]|nr:hypothetical protein [Bacillota bacterium]
MKAPKSHASPFSAGRGAWRGLFVNLILLHTTLVKCKGNKKAATIAARVACFWLACWLAFACAYRLGLPVGCAYRLALPVALLLCLFCKVFTACIIAHYLFLLACGISVALKNIAFIIPQTIQLQ